MGIIHTERRKVNLERKLTLFFILAAIIPILFQSAINYKIINEQFKKVQNERFELVRHNLYSTLDSQSSQLLFMNKDYSHWGDMYHNTNSKNMEWFNQVFDNLTSASMGVDMIYVLNDDREVVYEYNPTTDFISRNEHTLQTAYWGKEVETFDIIDGQLHMVTYTKITDVENTLDTNGVLIMSKVLNNEQISRFPKAYNFKYDIIADGASIGTGEKVENFAALMGMNPDQLERAVPKIRYYKLHNYSGKTIALLEVKEVGNSIQDLGYMTQQSSIVVVGITLIIVLIFVTLLKNNIMGPIKELRQKVNRMRSGSASNSHESDEIMALAEDFSAMSMEISMHTSEIEEQNKTLQYLVYNDDITGAYNKRFFRMKLREEFQIAVANEGSLCLALIDIDFFKLYRELISVSGGNEVLSTVYKVIKERLNENSFICFDGTDEFRIIMSNIPYKDAIDAISDIAATINKQHFIGMEQLPLGNISVSSGIANYPKDADDVDKLYFAARDRLHRAKHHGQGNVGYFYTIFNDMKDDIDADRKTLVYASKAFLAVIDAMDEYTYTHTEGVVKYACLIAEELGLDGKHIENIRIGALLHDIGKLELGRELLNKKERLTDDEVRLIKQHPIFGVNMLKTLRYFEEITDIVKYHHERYDGKGYPEGLSDNHIPLGARIVAVADSFDAMTTTRAYRTAHKTYAEAMEELMKCQGAQFDPIIVQAFANYINKHGYNFNIIE